MGKFLKTSHVVYRCEYHFVWVPKYRYRVLIGEVRERLREILRELCEWQEITILEGAIKEDHVHLYLSVPPKHSPSHVMKILKGKSAEYLAREYPELAKRYWGMQETGAWSEVLWHPQTKGWETESPWPKPTAPVSYPTVVNSELAIWRWGEGRAGVKEQDLISGRINLT
jgi:REP element-mobilizing transposase RayT